jgi:hypothetical protein
MRIWGKLWTTPNNNHYLWKSRNSLLLSTTFPNLNFRNESEAGPSGDEDEDEDEDEDVWTS